MDVKTPVIDATSQPVTVSEKETANNTQAVPTKSAPVKGPADDLRSIQNLLVSGIFPGNMAPAVVQGFSLLDAMAAAVESGSLKITSKDTK